MKKILAFVIAAVFAAAVLPSTFAQSKRDIMLNLEQIDHPSALKLFKKATAQCQLENLSSLVREAEKAYYASKTLDDLYELDTKLDVLGQFLRISKESFSQVESDYKILRRKVSKSIYDQDQDGYDKFDGGIRGDRGQSE